MYSWCSLLASCWMRAGAVTDARMMGDYVFNVKSYRVPPTHSGKTKLWEIRALARALFSLARGKSPRLPSRGIQTKPGVGQGGGEGLFPVHSGPRQV